MTLPPQPPDPFPKPGPPTIPKPPPEPTPDSAANESHPHRLSQSRSPKVPVVVLHIFHEGVRMASQPSIALVSPPG